MSVAFCGCIGDLFFACDPPRFSRRKTGPAGKPFKAENAIDLIDQPKFKTLPH